MAQSARVYFQRERLPDETWCLWEIMNCETNDIAIKVIIWKKTSKKSDEVPGNHKVATVKLKMFSK